MQTPAGEPQRLTSDLDLDDLALEPGTVRTLRDLQREADSGAGAGLFAAFHGPKGSGKTLTATLLGKSLGREVYRIDLSQVVSKYIGETEKNLQQLFALAESKDWILFFDEADDLFGKRSDEAAAVLDLLSDYPGVVIVAVSDEDAPSEELGRRCRTTLRFPLSRR